MGILGYIEDLKQKSKNRQYNRELVEQERNTKELTLLQARRAMLKEQSDVRQAVENEKKQIASLTPPSKADKLFMGLKTFKKEMDEHRTKRLVEQSKAEKKQSKGKKKEPQPFGSYDGEKLF